MKRVFGVLLAVSTLSLIPRVHAQSHKYDTWDQNYKVQALLGAVKYEDLKFTNDDGTDATEIDMSTIPQLGGAWSTLPKGERLQYGLECSFLLGFKFDSVNYAYLGGNGAYVSISTSMWMIDFAGGAYANIWLTDNLRMYGGAGPLMVFADYRSDRDYDDTTPDVSSNESAFGIGVYARTGFEFRIHQMGMLGLGVRGNWSNVDFSDVGGNSDISGIAGFVTYTAGL
jgi:hypothetical protein